MTMLNSREQGYELGFAHDEELNFKIRAHRNALFGHWAAGQIGYAGEAADTYAAAVVDALCQPAADTLAVDEAVVSNVSSDLTAEGIDTTPGEIRAILSEFEVQARQAVISGVSA